MSRKPAKPAAKPKPKPSSAPSQLAPSSRAATLGVCAFLALAVLLVFGRSAWFEFVDFDDPGVVSENPMVKAGFTPRGLLWAFTHTQISQWVPLTTLSHMVDSQLFGLWAGGHHLTNILLHATASILLFLVLRDMTGSFWRSAFVAAFFALHPLRAESVAWITERKDVLSGVFFMLTVGAYVRWTRQPKGSKGWLWVAGFLALGLLCKPMLVTVPVVLLLLDHWPLQRAARIRFSRLVIEKIPLLVLCAGAALGQILAAREVIDTLTTAPLSTRAANAVVSCATYLVQMFWPANLAAYYPFPRQGVDGLALLGAAVLLIAVSVVVYRWQRQAPWLATGWLWFLVMVAPVLGLIQAGEVARADRYTYLPQIGLLIMVVWTLGSWCATHARRRTVAAAVAVAALAAASVAAHRQTGYWKDSETLWQRALACTTNNDTAHFNLGSARLNAGRFDDAIAHFHKTLEANPGYADAHINLGRVFLQIGSPDKALAHFWKALDTKPRFAQAHYNIAIVFAQTGKPVEAVAQYKKAIEIDPAFFDARNNLGSLLLQGGRPDEAIAQYKTALRIDPMSAKAHNNLATAYAQKGRTAEAVIHYKKVLEIEPDHAKALNGLAWLLATSTEPSIRQNAKAIELADRANQLTGGNNPAMLRTLATAYAEASQLENAQKTARRALDLANEQKNESLARSLTDDLERYKAGKPPQANDAEKPPPDKPQSPK